MTISIRRMSLGSGYRYLIDSVACGDGAVEHASALTRYYAESGTPPGRFLGAGLADLNDGRGVDAGSEVTEEMLFNMLGLCADPITGGPLGRAANLWPKPLPIRVKDRIAAIPGGLDRRDRAARVAAIEREEGERERQLVRPVAGFDLTFSVPKSISVAWALADPDTQRVIYAAHQEAIVRTISRAERHTFFTRSGTNGVVQEPVRGVVAAGFDHWDSRAGDPQLHTHVVVLNRVQRLDGAWRTLDSRALYKQVVALSELHQGILTDFLTARLGWSFDARARRHSAAPKWEVSGVGDELQREFSQRTRQMEVEKERLIGVFTAQHGRRPTLVEVTRLRQQATLTTRPDKQHQSLHAQTLAWRLRARPYLDRDPAGWVQALARPTALRVLHAADLPGAAVTALAQVAVETVAERRATFSHANVLAEVHRQLHGVHFAAPEERIAAAERVTDAALAAAVQLTPPEMHHVPAAFQRPDGSSAFRHVGAELYTTTALLRAEERLLAAGGEECSPTVDRAVVAAVCAQPLPGTARRPSVAQTRALEQIATSGRVLDVLVGPAGTGKSTAMAALRAVWEAQHGSGSVIGLAPSAGAAEVLADELGIGTENTAKWLYEHQRQAHRRVQHAQLHARLGSGLTPLGRRRLATRIAAIRQDADRWALKPGQLVIVDEASLASTRDLDLLASYARAAGAKVLLVGDVAQLSAVEAGGGFALLVSARNPAPELCDVRRFTHSWEKTASTRLRAGDPAAIAAYTHHRRIHAGNRGDLVDAVYAAWSTDIAAGRTSAMIAPDLDTVAALNRRAHVDRVTAGTVTAHGTRVAADGIAGVGDRVVTRHNDRQLRTGRRHWVKNGDTWIVTAVGRQGTLTVRRERGHGHVTLPVQYVREHVELAYATTAHRAQGRTMDTAHALITPASTREILYVAATRGRAANHIYVDTCHDPDPATAHGPTPPVAPEAVLAAVMANVGADQSAHTIRERQRTAAVSIATLAAEYTTLAHTAQADRWDKLLAASGLTTDQLDDIHESDAYGPLSAALRSAEAHDLPISDTLPSLVGGRELQTAQDIASVLSDRVHRWISAAVQNRGQDGPAFIAGLLPTAQHIDDPDMSRALADRAKAIGHRARTLAEQAITYDADWVRTLGTPPADPGRYQRWIHHVSTVAAFHDRWRTAGSGTRAEADRCRIERARDAEHAELAAARARRIAQTSHPVDHGSDYGEDLPSTVDHGRSHIHALTYALSTARVYP